MFPSCLTLDEKIVCLDKLTESWSQEKVHQDIRVELDSTIHTWADAGVRLAVRYNKTNWVIDETVFFNTSKDAALLMVLEQDTAFDAKMDDTELIYAKKAKGIWHFYSAGMPAIASQRYYKDTDPALPYSFKELADKGKRKILNGGYLKKCSCKVNDDYVNDWYSESLEKMHQEFINER